MNRLAADSGGGEGAAVLLGLISHHHMFSSVKVGEAVKIVFFLRGKFLVDCVMFWFRILSPVPLEYVTDQIPT